MKKYILLLICLATINISANTENEARKILDNQQRQLDTEQNRLQQELRKKELENTKFDSNSQLNTYTDDLQLDNSNKFFIAKINIKDEFSLLSNSKKKKILKKYLYRELGSNEIKNLLTELTNTLISDGYITSIVTLEDGNDLTTGNLNLKVIEGRIEKIVINNENGLDKFKEFFMFPKNEGEIINIRDLDTATENFNSLQSNHFNMEIKASDLQSHSSILVTNQLKNKYRIMLTTNNHGENNQNGIWRYGISFNIDSPLGIGDSFFFSYSTVHRKEADRSWKKTLDQLNPGEILPIGPPGYSPADGDTLPYKRRLDLFNFGYTAKFRDYTLRLASNKNIQESSLYSFNTIYDMKSSSHTLSANLDKILFRNQKSKLTAGIGLKRKHSDNYLETAVLSNRKLSIGTANITYTTSAYKGLLGISLGYERGLNWFGAESDENKLDKTPKAQFNKYTVDINYYKPITQKLTYRFNLSGTYSHDVMYGSERQTIGGVGSVGGFHVDTVQGDKGIEIGQELSYNIPIGQNLGTVTPYIAYNYGAVKNNRDNSRYAIGYMTGLTTGLRYSSKFMDFDFGYAKPLTHSEYLNPKKQEMYFSGALKISF